MDDYQFTPTQDWFSGHTDVWRNLFPLVQTSAPKVLEIGSWEGRSAVFLLNELCGNQGSIVCIDHFDLMGTAAGRERFRKITHNLALTRNRHRIVDDFSVPALMTLLKEACGEENPGFDWVYIDGSHEADDTLLDGELAWRLARPQSIVIFDDYRWNAEPEDSPHHPRPGIDAFLQLHRGEYEVVSGNHEDHYQMILRKTSPMRIGFNFKGSSGSRVDEALNYGIHVAMAVDSAYAVPAAVTLLTLVKTNTRRLSIHVVDCGLSNEERRRLSLICRDESSITVNFYSLNEDSLATTLGPTWAKLDIISTVPVERLIYLDADILIRKDIADLWAQDLQGYPIAAAPDVGHPMGHGDLAGHPYFNAGVLLLDLTAIRATFAELRRLAQHMSLALHKDQDVLNTHFRGQWKALRLTWNAQGLGTYAKDYSDDRQRLPLTELEDPAIVHFSGHLHPPLGVVLNPWVQPYTSKPWGYAGAPGHPYAKMWWDAVEETPWKGWRQSKDYDESCRKAEADIVRTGIDAVQVLVKKERDAELGNS